MKLMYIVLLIAEIVIGGLLMSLAWVNVGWIPCVIALAICAALLLWQFIRLKQIYDSKRRRRIFGLIALILQIPIVVAVVMVIWLFVGLLSAI